MAVSDSAGRSSLPSIPAHSRAPPGGLADLHGYEQLGVVGFGSYGCGPGPVRPAECGC